MQRPRRRSQRLADKKPFEDSDDHWKRQKVRRKSDADEADKAVTTKKSKKATTTTADSDSDSDKSDVVMVPSGRK